MTMGCQLHVLAKYGTLLGPENGRWTLSTQDKFLSLPVTKPRFFGRPYRVLVATPTEISVKYSTYLKMLQMELSSLKDICFVL